MWPFPTTLIQYANKRLVIDRTRLLLSFHDPVEREEVRDFITPYDLTFEADATDPDDFLGPEAVVNDTDTLYWVRARRPIDADVLDALAEDERIRWVGPVYRRIDLTGRAAYLCPFPDVLLVAFDHEPRPAEVDEFESFGLVHHPKRSEYLPEFEYFSVVTEDRNAYQLRDLLASELETDRVELESVPLVSPVCFEPNDELFGKQWNLRRIDAVAGWEASVGDPDIVVGVLDTGVDLDHPDLDLVSDGFATDRWEQRADATPIEGPRDAPHGTAMAGVVAAAFHNGEGVAGVGGYCSIHPVNAKPFSESDLSAGLTRLVTEGVDVINMSIGWRGWNRRLVDTAIEAAHDADVVLVAAAGNGGRNSIEYPARHRHAIAVGATGRDDRRKTKRGSSDRKWGSNWGRRLDVVAPGVECWTTDLTGERPYNSTAGGAFKHGHTTYAECGSRDGNYFGLMGGTSAAAAHVSGLAALLRSDAPDDSNDRIRHCIRAGCETVHDGAYRYQGTATGPRSKKMGYGRINVRRSLFDE